MSFEFSSSMECWLSLPISDLFWTYFKFKWLLKSLLHRTALVPSLWSVSVSTSVSCARDFDGFASSSLSPRDDILRSVSTSVACDWCCPCWRLVDCMECMRECKLCLLPVKPSYMLWWFLLFVFSYLTKSLGCNLPMPSMKEVGASAILAVPSTTLLTGKTLLISAFIKLFFLCNLLLMRF